MARHVIVVGFDHPAESVADTIALSSGVKTHLEGQGASDVRVQRFVVIPDSSCTGHQLAPGEPELPDPVVTPLGGA